MTQIRALSSCELMKLLPQLLLARPSLMADLARIHDAVRIPTPGADLYYFSDPSHIRHILTLNAQNYTKGIGLIHADQLFGDGLLTSDGTEWKRTRSALSPLFSHGRLELVENAALHHLSRFKESLLGLKRSLRSSEVQSLAVKFTFGVLGETLLAQSLEQRELLHRHFARIESHAASRMIVSLLAPSISHVANCFLGRRDAYLDSVASELILAGWPGGAAEQINLLSCIACELPDRDLNYARNEVLTMLFAGGETTAILLSWALYLIGQHIEVWERLHREARGNSKLTHYGSVGQAKGLPYAIAVIHEVLRLYPPVWMLSRRAIAEDELADGYLVPANSNVLICPYALHRDVRYWSEPDEFIPDRFLGRGRHYVPFTYLPFGAGRRTCPGRSIAMLEASMLISGICRDFRILSSGSPRVRDGCLTLQAPGVRGFRFVPLESVD